MSNKSKQELRALLAGLTNIDQARLIAILAPRISVFVGMIGDYCVSGKLSPLSPIAMNGKDFQLNMEYVDLSEGDNFQNEMIAEVAIHLQHNTPNKETANGN